MGNCKSKGFCTGGKLFLNGSDHGLFSPFSTTFVFLKLKQVEWTASSKIYDLGPDILKMWTATWSASRSFLSSVKLRVLIWSCSPQWNSGGKSEYRLQVIVLFSWSCIGSFFLPTKRHGWREGSEAVCFRVILVNIVFF